MEQTQQLLDAAWDTVVNKYLDVVAAIVIFAVGRVFAGWARKLTRKALERGNVDATLVRVIALLLLIFSGGVVILVYVVLMLLLPFAAPQPGSEALRKIPRKTREIVESLRSKVSEVGS